MKKWLIAAMFSSKKFWYAISSVVVPIIITKLGVDETTASNLFWALIALTGAQGVADIGKNK
tara:strand:- start:369 stop:554 length:186 start_codon:yes stop_codon:yes gene_type:complete